jgi:hypothetical protein
MKAEWKKPSLIILSRGNPEEMVLFKYKRVGATVIGPENGQNKCDVAPSKPDSSCGACQAESGGNS